MSEHIVRQTRQKDAIREALSGNDEFISAQDLHRKLEDEGVHIGLATVYRQLNALVESGRADTVRLDGQQLYRLCGDDGLHHRIAHRRGVRPVPRLSAPSIAAREDVALSPASSENRKEICSHTALFRNIYHNEHGKT